MTCIVGMVENGKVYIAGDSAGVNSNFQSTVRADTKVFQVGEFLFGGCGSFRMIQLLRYKLEAPARKECQEDYEYLVSDWLEAVRAVMKEGGCIEEDEGVESIPGSFLVGYRGGLYEVDNDFQVAQSSDGMMACGCADDVALGSLYTSVNLRPNMPGMTPELMLQIALAAATNFSGGVRAPYIIKVLEPENNEESK
jgi:ATP-dependent protease HslVU (ClpYQ) peptidase subunit